MIESKLLDKLDGAIQRERPALILVTGASGAGKTHLIDAMEGAVVHPNIGYFKFDTIGIPSLEEMIEHSGSGEAWQRFATREWMKRFAEDPATPPAVIFEGQYNLDFAIEALQEFGFTDFRLIVATVPDEVMAQRLSELRGQPELVNNDMRNWAAFLKKQGQEKGALLLDTSSMSTEAAVHVIAQELIEIL